MTHPHHSTSVWMSIKHPSRWRMSLKITVLRSPIAGPWARVSVTGSHSSVSGSRHVSPRSWSTKPALAGIDSLAP
jgi:hypothetical protein